MRIPTYKKHNLEILISTTKKNNLDFIENIFFENPQHNFPIIIVNQAGKIKNSNNKNIKIINTETKGLSKSRNIDDKTMVFKGIMTACKSEKLALASLDPYFYIQILFKIKCNRKNLDGTKNNSFIFLDKNRYSDKQNELVFF